MLLKPKSWLEAQLAIVSSIYTIMNERTYPLSHWINRLTALHQSLVSSLPGGTSYITLVPFKKGPQSGQPQSWKVKHPSGLAIKPREKHFALSTYGSSEASL